MCEGLKMIHDTLNFYSPSDYYSSQGVETEYTFDIGKIKIALEGEDTDENFKKAQAEALVKFKDMICHPDGVRTYEY